MGDKVIAWDEEVDRESSIMHHDWKEDLFDSDLGVDGLMRGHLVMCISVAEIGMGFNDKGKVPGDAMACARMSTLPFLCARPLP